MTVVVAIKVSGQGAVLVADGKVSDDTGRIWSTTSKKIVQLTAATVGVAGNLVLLDELKRAAPHTADGVKEFVRENAFMTPYELVCYDQIYERLWTLDEDGMYIEYPHWVAVGIGGPIASGAMMMARPPTTLSDALMLGRQAVKASAALNGFCGGVSHWNVCARIHPEVPVSTPPAGKRKRAMEFNGLITKFDNPTGIGLLRIGKKHFDFHVSCYSGTASPAAKMKVAVDISSTGGVLSVRPRKA
jgi:hypothetical protein